MPSYEYDVALSFAGEHRPKVEQLARLLRRAGLSVFYDDWENADLWGRDLVQHLDEVYSKKALFCVIFISAEYVAKAWTNHELKSAQARAFRDKKEYILPLRLDDTAVPGIRETTGFLDLRKRTIEDVAELTIRKVAAAKLPPTPAAKGKAGTTAKTTAAAGRAAKKPAKSPGLSRNLLVKKHFTDRDRDVFVEKALTSIARLFKTSLAALESEHRGIVGAFRKLNNDHFTAVVYRDGKAVSKCGIRLGGGLGWGGKQIAYSDQPESTNSMNDWVTVADDGQTLFLKASSHSGMFGGPKPKDHLTPKDAAELFWARLMAPLQR